ncbi:hypothetical protein AZE42_11396 [Rhizopogon vesiculosus]|uniref:Uncharacterized protein n=1 Tax=Rhizopogon vesiculosus TaxID=180088 RepID=A0A1J8RDK4_9AGAM|nr:hypothetical protein AZE42_11396 [Rhizopogon vesiculosus]
MNEAYLTTAASRSPLRAKTNFHISSDDLPIDLRTHVWSLRALSSPLTDTDLLHMTIVSNDPSWWPEIDTHRFFSYFLVASSATVTYDWGEQHNISQGHY